MDFQVMVKPAGAACNLRCTYCFYTEKENLYGGENRLRMPPEVLERFVRQYIEAQDAPEVHFAWQGGEPTLMGLDFFRAAVALQARYAGSKKITNAIQTNGTRLTDDWCRFLRQHEFLVGLSVDGPQELHDRHRTRAGGHSTFEAVTAAGKRLKRYKVAFNTLTVVNAHNARRPLEVYRFLKAIGDGHMQFIPAVERLPDETARDLGLGLALPPEGDRRSDNRVTPWSVSPRQLADFYIRIFDAWVRNDVGRVFVQFFDVALGNWMGAGSGLCQFAPTCGRAAVLEHNGDLYACDHYVYPRYKLGNIMDTPLAHLMASAPQLAFGRAKQTLLPRYCQACAVRPACHGDCPKHRFVRTPDGEPGLSYLCPAYKAIFDHMAPYLNIMAELVRSGRPAAEIMGIVRQPHAGRGPTAPGRNAACPCGSGQKYKRCCGA
ncbi:MAG: anaerobic sulfatase maturase [Desulfobacterales bacterium]|nr:anaerobic sulfatase maturase [Desulfobacterales bacterium]